jgi:saccharopine dehydrogenase (NAD+, L-lysine-forming)
VQAGLKRLVELFFTGPDEETRRRGQVQVWGQVTGPNGQLVHGTLSTPESYRFTADSALTSLERVLEGVEPGALTPSMAFGADFVSSCEGVEVYELESS